MKSNIIGGTTIGGCVSQHPNRIKTPSLLSASLRASSFSESALRKAVRRSFTLVPILAGGLAVSAHAQDATKDTEKPVEVDKVQVTGSRIRAVDTETSNPVFSINRDAIRLTGATTIGDLLQQLPAASGVATNPQVNNGGGNGAASVNLRGLGPERTLVLVDGRRVVGTTFSDLDYFDLNTLPINMVERVEVLKEGASAVYGSDAIGGVVNIITRKQFSGAEAEATYGKTTEGDGRHRDINFTYGAHSAHGHAVFGLEYQDQGEIMAKDRAISSLPTAYYYGHKSPNVGTSSRVPGGRWFLPAGNSFGCGSVTRLPGTDGNSLDDYRCFTNNFDVGETDRYNFLGENLLLTPAKRYEAFMEGENDVTSNIQFFGFGLFNHTQSNSQLAAEPFDNGTTQAVIGAPVISANNVYNPFGADISTFALRPTLVGDRIETVNTSTYQGTLGFRGTLIDKYQWETAYSYGRIDQHESDYGFLNFSGLLSALGPSFFADADGNAVVPVTPGVAPAGTTAVCGTPGNIIQQCAPINPFGTIGNTIAATGTTANKVIKQTQKAYDATINGDLFTLPAGPLAAAFGFEWRKYTLDSIPDGLEQAFLLSENNSRPTQGDYEVREFYAELRIPILANKPWVESLILTPGVRHSNYSTFGNTTNAKYGLEYRPIHDLLLRYTYAEVFRAPTVNDLFKGDLQDAPLFTDLCNGLAADDTDPNHLAACRNVVADGTFRQANNQATAVRKGNPDLQPETGFTTDVGFVYNPSWYRPMTLEADLWHYNIKNAIGLIDTGTSLNACFNFGILCEDVGRDADGQLSQGIEPLANLGRFDTSGLDFGVALRYPKTRWGSWTAKVDTAYLADYHTTLEAQGVLLDSIDFQGKGDGGGTGSFPRWKTFSTLTWKGGDFSIDVRDRFIGSFTEGSFYSPQGNQDGAIDANDAGQCAGAGKTAPVDPADPTGLQLRCSRKSGIANYVDTSVTYELAKFGAAFTAGVTDMFNQRGRFLASGTLVGNGTGYPTDTTLYDLTGRAFFGRVRVTFK